MKTKRKHHHHEEFDNIVNRVLVPKDTPNEVIEVSIQARNEENVGNGCDRELTPEDAAFPGGGRKKADNGGQTEHDWKEHTPSVKARCSKCDCDDGHEGQRIRD